MPHQRSSWLVAMAALLLTGARCGTGSATESTGLREAIAPNAAPFLPGAPVQAAVLLQLSDCSGNLRMVDLLHRQSVREQVALRVVWYVGAVTDSSAIRRALPTWAQSVALHPAPAPALRELRRLGHVSTPLLVVFDAGGRVRLTTQSPASVREFAGLQRILEGLTWIAEL